MLNVIIIGAGINGATAAIELKKRGHRVTLVDPGPLPHPLAASTDISKAVRAAYGPDEIYTEMAERSIALWHEWNNKFGVQLYHEVGMLLLRRRPMQPGDFEYESCRLLLERGHPFERLTREDLRARFPAFNAEMFNDGVFDPRAGYVESGRVVATLVDYAKSLGVDLREQGKVVGLPENNRGVLIEDRSAFGRRADPRRGRQSILGDMVVVATGAWTPYLLPFTKSFFRASGQPVFHFRPAKPELFAPERFPFFTTDISTTGYYGFSMNQGVVKIANHGAGREMSPDSPERVVTPDEEKEVREFLRSAIPTLASAPIVYTRLCLYCDTHDGDFWIAPDPDRPWLVIAAGDNGHGFKFAPVLGEIIADAVEGKPNPLLQKFRWRPEVCAGGQKEAARFLE
jgi:glycine/D-amino acid oxidase-like deaminating enzyme